MAHTPGPWHKERNNSPHSSYPYRIRHDNGDGTTRDVGECWHFEDARLIAAAPAMREALERAEHLLSVTMGNGVWELRKAIAALLATIDGDR
jgi:hypothetical protein